MKTSSNSMAQNTREQLTFFPVDSHVNLSPKQAKERAKKMTVTSGLKCLELYGRYNRNGSWAKTLLGSLLGQAGWYSSKCVLTWKQRATRYNRWLFQLAPSVRRTEGIEFGLLHTPRALQIVEDPKRFQERMGDRNSTTYPNLATQIEYLLPTPDAHERGARKNQNGHQITLQDQIGMLPTPQERDWKGRSQRSNRGEVADDLSHKIEGNPSLGTKTGLKLQPNFVEWMMGYPLNWTDLSSQNQNTEQKD